MLNYQLYNTNIRFFSDRLGSNYTLAITIPLAIVLILIAAGLIYKYRLGYTFRNCFISFRYDATVFLLIFYSE